MDFVLQVSRKHTEQIFFSSYNYSHQSASVRSLLFCHAECGDQFILVAIKSAEEREQRCSEQPTHPFTHNEVRLTFIRASVDSFKEELSLKFRHMF